MNRLIPLALASVGVLGIAPPASADHRGKVPWVEDFQAGLNQARATGKPVMLLFTTSR